MQFAKLFGPDDDQLLVTLEEDQNTYKDAKPLIRYTRPLRHGPGTQSYIYECRDWEQAERMFATIDASKAQAAFKLLEDRSSGFDILDEQAAG